MSVLLFCCHQWRLEANTRLSLQSLFSYRGFCIPRGKGLFSGVYTTLILYMFQKELGEVSCLLCLSLSLCLKFYQATRFIYQLHSHFDDLMAYYGVNDSSFGTLCRLITQLQALC